MSRPADLIDFWLADAVGSAEQALARHPTWYRCGPDFDAEIESRFGDVVTDALAGGLTDWEQTPEGSLALVLALDQFTRNRFRGTVDVYAGDARAWRVADTCVTEQDFTALPVMGQMFLFHPFHHSELPEQQNRAVRMVRELRERAGEEWAGYLGRSVEGFSRHRDIVVRFGRFPHRNAVLGRENTPEEQAFLDAGADHFGQGPPAGKGAAS